MREAFDMIKIVIQDIWKANDRPHWSKINVDSKLIATQKIEDEIDFQQDIITW